VLYSVVISSKAFKYERHVDIVPGEVLLQALSGFHQPRRGVQKTVSFLRDNYTLPPLRSILAENNTIVGDPQILLHFAVIGFGKCGTTSLIRLLNSHNGLQTLESEVWALIERNPARLIERLHKKLVDNLPRGYKCPGDVLANYALDFYRMYWPQTRLIIGVRHPVLWFQSLYNFRVQILRDFQSLPEPNELVGSCTKEMKMICTKRGHFAWYLMHLGKQFLVPGTNGSRATSRRFTPLDKQIVHYYAKNPIYRRRIKPMHNPVFLFDVNQLGDANETRRELFRRDLANFLGVDPSGYGTELTANLDHVSPGRTWDAATQALKDEKKINICDPQHLKARTELLRHARLSSRWIRRVFLNSLGVVSSSREFLESLLAKWMVDPCSGNGLGQDTVTDVGGMGAKVDAEFPPEYPLLKLPRSDAVSPLEDPLWKLPPYDSLFNDTGDLIGDPHVLLHFAVIGFGKAGTTSLIEWLGDHPELQVLRGELWALPMQQPKRLLNRLYVMLSKSLRRGYKCPGDVISDYARNYYRTVLPKTRLFVGLRHPVLWFESLYNFRLQNLEGNETLPNPNTLVGTCRKNTKRVCTYRGNFAHHLLQFGKHANATTRPFTPLEQQLATWYRKYQFGPIDIKPVPNEMFVYEVNQLGDNEESRRNQLRRDIESFLGLSRELPEASVHRTPGKVWEEAIQADKDRRKISICDDSWLPLRAELMLQARTSSLWIRHVFLDSPGVHVSSREYFEELLKRWMVDPCNNKTDGINPPSLPSTY
jgi:hypothetical protein